MLAFSTAWRLGKSWVVINVWLSVLRGSGQAAVQIVQASSLLYWLPHTRVEFCRSL